MAAWSLKWRIFAETVLLVVAASVAVLLFDYPGAIVVGLAGLVFGYYRSRQLISSFNRITESILRTASIDRSNRLNPEGPAELQRMARAVNRLASRLVTATRRADEERERLGLILESMADGVMLVNEDGFVEFANPSAIHVLTLDRLFEAGMHLASLNDSFELNELATKPARTGVPGDVQIEVRSTGRFVQAIASPFMDRDGRRKSVLILGDITAVKRTEITRREFVSNASHELRTPIAAIKASAETLQLGAGDDPATRADFLGRILEDSARVENMVTEMLELSRLESGQTPLETGDVDAEEFLQKVIERFGHLAAASDVEVVLEPPSSPCVFRADSAKFEQVFANLVANAVRAIEGGGSIWLRVGAEGDRVVFEVEDDGSGIEAGRLPHLFERFYKVDSARSGEGTGLGLAISRHIVQAHGGEISVRSTVGEGTVFSIAMPAAGSSAGTGAGPDG